MMDRPQPLPRIAFDPVDWPQVIEGLRAGGMSWVDIAAAIGVARSTLLGWRRPGHEPRHCDGEVLLAFWRARLNSPIPKVTQSK